MENFLPGQFDSTLHPRHLLNGGNGDWSGQAAAADTLDALINIHFNSNFTTACHFLSQIILLSFYDFPRPECSLNCRFISVQSHRNKHSKTAYRHEGLLTIAIA